MHLISSSLITSDPLIPYYVKVAAYTMKGRGPYSDAALNFTQEGGLLFVCKSNFYVLQQYCLANTVPSDGPNITSIIRQANGSVIVSWEPLSLEEARGFITGYTATAIDQFGLYVRQMPVIPMTVGPHQTTATLCCLHPRHGYRISLSASTKHGESDAKMQIIEPVGKPNITLTMANGINEYCYIIFGR